jgi:polysaccharide pyruvyl transferase WcaK-like protein
MDASTAAKKVLVAGYYGHRNFGDDLLMSVVMDRLRANPGVGEISMICATEGMDYVSKWFPGVSLIDERTPLRTAVRSMDRVLFGGGGALFNYGSLPATSVWRRHLADWRTFGLANRRGVRFAYIGIGIGPFGNDGARRATLARLRWADFATVRDEQSLKYADSVMKGRASLGPDLSLADLARAERIGAEVRPRSRTLIVVRHFKYGSERDGYLSALRRAADAISHAGQDVRWASFQPAYDRPVIDELQRAGVEVWAWDPARMSLDDAFRTLAAAECVITARMHATFVCLMLGVPVVSIAVHPKLDFASQLAPELAAAVPADVDATAILRACDSVRKAAPGEAKSRLEASARDAGTIIERAVTWAAGAST